MNTREIVLLLYRTRTLYVSIILLAVMVSLVSLLCADLGPIFQIRFFDYILFFTF